MYDFVTFGSLILHIRSATTFGPLSASLFTPQNIWVQEATPVNYSTILGRSPTINATYSYIRALLLSSAQGNYEVSLFVLLSLIYLTLFEDREGLVFRLSPVKNGLLRP